MRSPDYFPLIPNTILEYKGETGAGEWSTSTFEVMEVKQIWPSPVSDFKQPTTRAKCRNRWVKYDEAEIRDQGVREFEVVKREDGFFEGRRLILPMPISIGTSWSEYNLSCAITSLTATTKGPAGTFDNCLQVSYSIAGGDAGSGYRLYAPGVGLIREDYGDEASPWMRILTKTSIPYDVFIAHASEDKDVVHPLAEALRHQGLRVWYDRFVLKLGDSLNQTINEGIAGSRYGIVILSPNFFQKNWPQQELNGLVAREIIGSGKIIPVYHNFSHEQVAQRLPIISDRLAGSTKDGIEHLVSAILQAVAPDAA
jgi:TIR domain